MRKRAHMIYVRRYIVELRWEIINTTIVASSTQWNEDVVHFLNNRGALIRKYERRKRWLKF